MLSFSEFQAKARSTFGNEEYIGSTDPLSFLYSLDWNTPIGEPYSEEKLARMNLEFDTNGCFGRALKAAVLVEKYFPQETFYSAEVCEDLFREILVEGATPAKWRDETYVEEILQYENPHIILVWNDKQFDASFKLISETPTRCAHPKVKRHDLWKGLYVAYVISAISVAYGRSAEKTLRAFEEIETFYPEMITLKENKVSALIALDKISEAIALIKEIVEVRKDAKVLFSLWYLSGDDVYKTRFLEEYSIEMFYYLTKKILV